MDYFSIQAQSNYDYKNEKQKINNIKLAYVTKKKLKINK